MSGSASKLLPLRIRLPYTTEEEFIDKYGSNVARGGVFVATRALKPEGTGLAFEFVLADGTRLLRGEGVVVKTQVDAGGGRAGMTVRFVKLDAASKALIDRVVARRSGESLPGSTVAGRRMEATPLPGAGIRTPVPVTRPPQVETPAPVEAAPQEPARAEPKEETDEDLGFDITASITEPEPQQPAPTIEKPEPVTPAYGRREVTPASDAEVSSIMRSWLEEPAGSPETPTPARVSEPTSNGTARTPAAVPTPAGHAEPSSQVTEPSAPAEVFTARAGSRTAEPASQATPRTEPGIPLVAPSATPTTATPLESPTANPAARAESGTSLTESPATPGARDEPGTTPAAPPAASAEALPARPQSGPPAAEAGPNAQAAASIVTARAEPGALPTTPAAPAATAEPTTRAEPEALPSTSVASAKTAEPEGQPTPPSEATTTRAEPEALPSTSAASTTAAEPESRPTAPSEATTARAEPGAPHSAPTEPTTARAEPVTPQPAPIEPTPAQEAEAARNRRRALLDVPVTTQAPAPAVPEVVLGIDVGTSHARVAVFHEGTAKLIPIPGADGTELPALIAVDGSDELLVGPAAQVEASRAPRRAAAGLKRLVGLRARSPRLRALASQLPFPITADARGDAGVELGGRLVAPTLFTAMLLRELKHAAANFLGRKVTRAIICAPTHFTERQRAALREAAMLAGLEAQRIVTAPVAAALAYGQGRGLARKRVLVVDLGGGGLEVCVVQVTGDDLEVITTGGDPMVGGMDFDARIAEAFASELASQGIPRPEHALDWAPLRTAAESAKVALSGQEQVDVPLSPGTVPPLSRERMEALTADLAQRVTAVVREVLETNALSPQGLDAVLLVGAQGRSPLVRRRLEESLGVPVRDDVDPRGAVALGAALLGQAMLLARDGKPAATVSEVLPAPIGVAERAGTLHRVLERNTRLPAGKTLALMSVPGPLDLALFQGPSPLATENEYLGRLRLVVERPGEVELHFTLSSDGALSLEATLPGGKRHPVTLATEDQDEAALAALIARSPLEGEPEARPGGLLSGLKKLFGRR